MHSDDRGLIELFTNTGARRDFVRSAFERFSARPQNVLVAVAFLTDPDPLLRLVERGSRLRVIVRLGYPTRPSALRKLLHVEGVQLRATSKSTFHPKLYIFPRDGALVGSSNMTQAALNGNQEVNVLIPSGDPLFPELTAVFDEYWTQVEPLDEEKIAAYQSFLDRFKAARKELEAMDALCEQLISARIDNIDRGRREGTRADLFIEEYRAEYQSFVSAFQTVRRVYGASGQRKHPEATLPLRIEVDAFLGWIRSRYTEGQSYLAEPLLAGDELEGKIRTAMKDWFSESYSHIDDVAARRYPLLEKTFGSADRLQRATFDQIIEALSCETSFYDRLRYYKGGHQKHIAVFREANSLEHVRHVLGYLLFGRDDPVIRMYRCIHDSGYRLREFGRSAVQELLGWMNSEEIPICNSRTLRSLRWLGFDVTLYGD
ncbi:MAG: hypothetical protein IBJ03_06405 [Gemmatimonadaceae bacterium]|nr:hypothetical protein [Gemmatimonadaceae bacterium]